MESGKELNDVLNFFAEEDGKKKIEDGLAELQEIYPELECLDHLLITPGLIYKPQTIVILAILKENSYIRSAPIQEMIECLAGCEEDNHLFVLNNLDMKRLSEDGRIREREFHNLRKYSLRLQYFDLQFHLKLKTQYEIIYKEADIAEDSVKIFQQIKQKVEHQEQKDKVGHQEKNDKGELQRKDDKVENQEKEDKGELQRKDDKVENQEKEDKGEYQEQEDKVEYQVNQDELKSLNRKFGLLVLKKHELEELKKKYESMYPEQKDELKSDPQSPDFDTRNQGLKDKLEHQEYKDELEYVKKYADKHYIKLSENECHKIKESLRFVLQFWGNQNSQNKQTTLLHLAAARGAEEPYFPLISIGEAMALIKFLLGVDPEIEAEKAPQCGLTKKEGIEDINAQDESGKTALHWAARSSGGLIYWLLQLKADPFIEDKHGKTFFDYIPEKWFLIRASLKHYKRPEMKIDS